MKKFKFNLEIVLGERKRSEDLRLREWTLARKILQTMLDDLNALETRLVKAFDESTDLAMKQSGLGGSNIAMLGTVESFISGVKVKIQWKKQEIERALKLTERTRVEYVKARQKREALEKLKASRHEEFRKRVRKRELKDLDDMYVMSGAARRRSEEEEETL
ncbi:MAG: flagellar export protein FliJ [Bdellovibrionota bacterium]